MLHFFEWFSKNLPAPDPWLILGKGPSFALRHRLDLQPFHLLSLNHAVREQPVLVAHVIDMDVVQACADAIAENARVLVMPWYPHIRNLPGQRTLQQIADEVPLLRRLDAEQRLLWYDLSTSPIRHGPGPVVRATYFSAEAALNLLAHAGVRRVRSLGVDGGSAYSAAFEDLSGSTLLANGRSSFDLQFAGFARTILETGVDFAPLDLAGPPRVAVAHTRGELIPAAVLEHSIHRHCSLTVEVQLLAEEGPRRMSADGPTVLLPPTAQVLMDLRPLWRAEVRDDELMVPAGNEYMGLALAGAGLSSAVPALAAMIRERASSERLNAAVEGKVRPALARDWNPVTQSDGLGEPRVLYYPADGSEPWRARNHPAGHLWVRDLLEAVRYGQLQVSLIAQAVREGHVRPSLLYQVEHGLEEPLLLPPRARRLDRDFVRVHGRRPQAPGQRWAGVSRALARQLRRELRLLRSWSSKRLRTHLAVRQ